MNLILRVERYRDAAPPEPLQACFDADGGTLGRAPGNRLVLADPGKYLSRSHASVSLRDGCFYLLDTGSNPSIVNGRPLGAGTESALADGDRIVIGDYLLGVTVDVASADATMIAPPPPPPPPPVFEGFLPPPAPAAQIDAAPDFLAGARILDDAPAPHDDDPLGLNLPARAAPAAHHDHVAPEMQAFSIPADYDPLADRQPPSRQAPPPVPVARAEDHAEDCAEDSTVLQALLDGLGLPHLQSRHSPEALARLVGEIARALTAGAMDVLVARALTKRESHIDMTMIAPRANNPLKFFPDADSALTQMLGAQIPGYLAPLPAIAGAFDDLKAHELAVIAGMRAALAAVVQRFDPARVEQRMVEAGRFDRLLPGGRKARLWDRLVASYGELARDADDDLQRLFGENFSGAYAQRVARLRAGPPSFTPDSASIHVVAK